MKRSKAIGAAGYRRDVAYATIRELLAELGAKQVQFLTPTTDKMYIRIAKSKSKAIKSVELPENAQGHWIGNPQARYVMLYSHGKFVQVLVFAFPKAPCHYEGPIILTASDYRRWFLWICNNWTRSILIYTTREDGKAGTRLFDLCSDLHVVAESRVSDTVEASCFCAQLFADRRPAPRPGDGMSCLIHDIPERERERKTTATSFLY